MEQLHVPPLGEGIFAQGLVGLPRLGCRAGLELLQLLDVVEDRGELAAEPLDLLVGQLQTRQPGYVADVLRGYGHGAGR